MFLVYDDQPRTGKALSFDPSKINANRCYLEHYANSLYLQFMLMSGTTAEKAQASKELALCERKMKYHENHPNFNWSTVLPEIEKLKRSWVKK